MQIVFIGDIFHSVSDPAFSEKIRKKKEKEKNIILSSAESAKREVKVKIRPHR